MTATLPDVAAKKKTEPSAEQQAAAELVRMAKEQAADDRRDHRALRRDLRRVGIEGDDQQDHRPGDRGDAGVGQPPAR
jgi:hypothetical protein